MFEDRKYDIGNMEKWSDQHYFFRNPYNNFNNIIMFNDIQ